MRCTLSSGNPILSRDGFQTMPRKPSSRTGCNWDFSKLTWKPKKKNKESDCLVCLESQGVAAAMSQEKVVEIHNNSHTSSAKFGCYPICYGGRADASPDGRQVML